MVYNIYPSQVNFNLSARVWTVYIKTSLEKELSQLIDGVFRLHNADVNQTFSQDTKELLFKIGTNGRTVDLKLFLLILTDSLLILLDLGFLLFTKLQFDSLFLDNTVMGHESGMH